jgi:DNA-binding GntR family transcriptional regulator
MDDLFLAGSGTRLELSRREIIAPDAEAALDLWLDPGDEACHFEGVRYFGDGERALFSAWTPREIGEKIPFRELKGPLLIDMVERVSLERVGRARQQITAAVAGARHESLIGVRVGAPLLIVKHIYYTSAEHVLEVAETHFPGDSYRPVAMLERIAPTGSTRNYADTFETGGE